MFQMMNVIREVGLMEICDMLHDNAMNQIEVPKGTVHAMQEVGVELMMEAVLQLVNITLTAFPDLKLHIVDSFCEGEDNMVIMMCA